MYLSIFSNEILHISIHEARIENQFNIVMELNVSIIMVFLLVKAKTHS